MFWGRRHKWRDGNWFQRHSLSLVLLGIFVALNLIAYFTQHWDSATNDRLVWVNTSAHGLRDDAFGALLIVVVTKWFYEQGSPESKDSTDE